MPNSNKGQTPKKIKINRSNSIVEIKIGSSSISLSGKTSARPSKSVFRAKSYKKPFVTSLPAITTIKNLIS